MSVSNVTLKALVVSIHFIRQLVILIVAVYNGMYIRNFKFPCLCRGHCCEAFEV